MAAAAGHRASHLRRRIPGPGGAGWPRGGSGPTHPTRPPTTQPTPAPARAPGVALPRVGRGNDAPGLPGPRRRCCHPPAPEGPQRTWLRGRGWCGRGWWIGVRRPLSQPPLPWSTRMAGGLTLPHVPTQAVHHPAHPPYTHPPHPLQVVLSGRRRFFYLLDVESRAVERLASLRAWRDEKSFESFVTSQHSPQPSELRCCPGQHISCAVQRCRAGLMLGLGAFCCKCPVLVGAPLSGSIDHRRCFCLVAAQSLPSLATRGTCRWSACTPNR